MAAKNAFYAQSGGVTAVINASACGVIQTAKKYKKHIHKVFAGKDGILGALKEELIDTSKISAKNIQALLHTPGGAFGSCRYKLKSLEENRREYERLIEVFSAHNIGYFFYNGGGDSQDTANKVSQLSAKLNYPLQCIGIPKTVDNDLPITDNCPGYGSVAKYVAVSITEAALDIASMCSTSTKVFIMEVMGRHTGWIAAASGVAEIAGKNATDIILMPEVQFEEEKFLKRVSEVVQQKGFCTIVVSEGIRNTDGKFLSESGLKDAFGHSQLGGVAPTIASLIKNKLNLKYHWAVCDYLQRSARHIASKMDVEQAYALGKAAVECAIKGKNAVMPIIVRQSKKPYRYKIDTVALEKVANVEKHLPNNFISDDGFHITKKCREYILPLIKGEAYPPFKNGLPEYVKLKNILAKKKLKPFEK